MTAAVRSRALRGADVAGSRARLSHVCVQSSTASVLGGKRSDCGTGWRPNGTANPSTSMTSDPFGTSSWSAAALVLKTTSRADSMMDDSHPGQQVRDGAITYKSPPSSASRALPSPQTPTSARPTSSPTGTAPDTCSPPINRPSSTGLSTAWAPEQQTVIVLRIVASNTASNASARLCHLPAPYVGVLTLTSARFDPATGISTMSDRGR